MESLATVFVCSVWGVPPATTVHKLTQYHSSPRLQYLWKDFLFSVLTNMIKESERETAGLHRFEISVRAFVTCRADLTGWFNLKRWSWGTKVFNNCEYMGAFQTAYFYFPLVLKLPLQSIHVYNWDILLCHDSVPGTLSLFLLYPQQP